MMRDPLGRIPVTVVTGFLGSGKTTLLNHVLTHADCGRVAALVNDFGALDIDAALVAEVADEVVTLRNGCICCSINGDLLQATERLLTLDPPVDRIVVETTGIADPLPVGLTFLETALSARTSLESIVTVVDCAHFALDLFSADAAMAQIVHADIVVLNKADLAERSRIDSIANRIRAIKPKARTLEACFSNVPLAAILVPDAEPSVSGGNMTRKHSNHLLNDGFSSHAIRVEGTLSASRFQALLDRGLPEQVFRAKGIVRFDRSASRYVFQFCGGRSNFYPYDGLVNDNRLVFIGRGIDPSRLNGLLGDCLTPGSAVT
jgi:G3E family GTPase